MTGPSSPLPRRETTLHLLFLQDDQAALRTLVMNQTSYYGANVEEAARTAGLHVHLLRRLHFDYQGETNGIHKAQSVWHVQALDDTALPWQPIPDLPEQAQQWVNTARTPPSNIPWMHAGWHAEALAWLDAELAAQGWRRHGNPKVLKHWQISTLWQVETTHGNVYFKAVPDFFNREVQMTPILARELPGAAPPVLAADLKRRFLLLADAGTDLEGETPNLNDLMRHLAQLQRQSVPLLAGWKLRDHGPEYVLSWLDHLLCDECLMLGQDNGFTPDEAA